MKMLRGLVIVVAITVAVALLLTAAGTTAYWLLVPEQTRTGLEGDS